MTTATLTVPKPAIQPAAAPAPDLAALKTRQQAAWSSGDYAVVGTTLQIVGESLCEAVDLRAGQTVLDVAAGNGNASLAAARRWCDVTSTDYVPRSARARPRARRGRGLTSSSARPTPRRCRSPTPASTPWSRPSASCSRRTRTGRDRAAARLQARRQDRPGQLDAQRLHRPAVQDARQARAAAGRRRSRRRCGAREARSTRCSARRRPRSTDARAHFMFRYRSAQHWIDVFKTYYGPLLKAFAALDAAAQESPARRPHGADRHG